MENSRDRKLKKLISDRGGEFVNSNFKKLSEECRFMHIMSPPETPQHNSFAERANHTILEKARCLLAMSHLPASFWADAVNAAVFLSNLLPTASRDWESPNAIWSRTPPRLLRLRTFGCRAIIHKLSQHIKWKLDPHGQPGIFIGYENNNTAYRILQLQDLKVVVTRHAIFNERVFPSIPQISSQNSTFETKLDNQPLLEDNNPVELDDIPLPDNNIQESCSAPMPETQTLELTAQEDNDTTSHTTQAPSLRIIGPRHPTLVTTELDSLNILPYKRRPIALLTAVDDAPQNYRGALKAKDSLLWEEAINQELENMNHLKVWDVVGTTWVFKIKKKNQNEPIEYKARLCAQGFTQAMGIDFNKTYAPTGRLSSLRTLIAFASVNKLQFHQIDIKSAFLNAQLKETVYLAVPQGLELDKQRFCLRLNKAIYGLRQAPLAWYKRLKNWLRLVKFSDCTLDPCVFYRAGKVPVWLYLHVDNIGIFSQDTSIFKAEISGEFDIKDIGEADLILGVKIQRTEEGISLNQQHFAEALLEQYGMGSCKAMVTPLTPNEYLMPATEDEIVAFGKLKANDRSAIGSINYLSTATRPNLSFAVSALSQYLDRPGIKHWQAFLHVLKYLKGSINRGLHYSSEERNGITAFSDTDWGNCKETRRSTTGYLACFHKCLILWKTRKQPTISISTAEAEYKAVCDLTSELLWFRQWCEEANLFVFTNPILIFKDNQSCIKTANGDCNINNKHMKHIDIQLHFIKEAIQSNWVQLQ
ncbi:hypothetical protein O181_063046 [Austropuccinia psidii MF-1]|uniref:Integrase catalytic domain-containing protein n=1 Tax=Austropuccinia psidii MF-1 TaxID=1389203 RepID=A0A9Q3HZ21_9BASI|nr:hypothetical protein [Austropuccinia psidii MF-1]